MTTNISYHVLIKSSNNGLIYVATVENAPSASKAEKAAVNAFKRFGHSGDPNPAVVATITGEPLRIDVKEFGIDLLVDATRWI